MSSLGADDGQGSEAGRSDIQSLISNDGERVEPKARRRQHGVVTVNDADGCWF